MIATPEQPSTSLVESSTPLVAASATRNVILIRHAETAWNRERRYQGQTDIPLSDFGRQQARVLREKLLASAHLFDPGQTVVVSSDLARAHETAQIVFAGADIAVDRDLRESAYGVFEGLTREEIEERFPEHSELWHSGSDQVLVPGAEPRDVVRARVIRAIERWLNAAQHPYLAVVTHGGVMRQFMKFVRNDRGVEELNYRNGAAHVVSFSAGRFSYGGAL